MESNVTDIPWPAHSLHLNPIENFWGLMVEEIYRGNRRFETIEDLKEAIWLGWDKIDQARVRNLLKFI